MRSRLREWRTKRALSQQELADLAGVSKANISRIEAGLQKPRAATVRSLATALNVTTEDLILWGEDPPDGKRTLPGRFS